MSLASIKQKQALEKLDELKKQTHKYAKQETRRLIAERDWLKKLQTKGIDDTGREQKEQDKILTLNELDELLGRGSTS